MRIFTYTTFSRQYRKCFHSFSAQPNKLTGIKLESIYLLIRQPYSFNKLQITLQRARETYSFNTCDFKDEAEQTYFVKCLFFILNPSHTATIFYSILTSVDACCSHCQRCSRKKSKDIRYRQVYTRQYALQLTDGVWSYSVGGVYHSIPSTRSLLHVRPHNF